MSRRGAAALWALAVAVAVIGEGGFLLNRFAPLETIPLDMAVGLITMAAGVLMWSRRPGNLTGPLLYVAGAAWSLSGVWAYGVWPYWQGTPDTVSFLDDALIVTGVLLMPVHYSIIVYLVLAFPDGHLRSPVGLGVVGALWAGAIVIDATLLIDPVGHALLAVEGRPAYPLVDAVTSYGVGLLAFITLVLLLERWLGATAAARRILTPVLASAALLAGVEVMASIARAGDWMPPDRAIFGANVLAKLSVPIAYLYGAFRSRMARSSVGELVVDLGAADGRSLRDALARALRDPSVQLAYWVPARSEYVDSAGIPVSLPEGARSRAVTYVEREGERRAAIIHDPLLGDEEPALVEAVSAAARLALDNERLQAEVRAKLEEVRASRTRIVHAGDAERRRVERNLHDGAQQRLMMLALSVGQLRERLDGEVLPDVAEHIDAMSGELRQAIEELRELARGIHPAILTEDGLVPAIESLAERFRAPIELDLAPIDRLPEPVEATAYFVVAESLTNVAKYAGASHVDVRLDRRDSSLVVEITDDGRGGAAPWAGSGLQGLEDRVAAVGGTLFIDSPPGAGTRVVAEIPVT
jgi:signal transduction histidine kinase